jgi:hypothetical protein
MGIRRRDLEFRFTKITYVDYKHIEIDRTLLNLFPRLKFNGYSGRVQNASATLTVDHFVDEFVDGKNNAKFQGFAAHRDIVRKWVETDLLDLVNRGRPTQAVVSPRPLHGNTYKFRNTRHARDYGTSEQIYWMLYHAQNGQDARDHLRAFIFAGLDQSTDKLHLSAKIDVETQAILHLDDQVKRDMPDSKEPERFPPLCIRQANLMADDVLRLLAYEEHMPRSVLVEYLKILLAFHLGLYHLRLLKLVPTIVRNQGGELAACMVQGCPLVRGKAIPRTACAYPVGLVIDMGDVSNQHMAELARRSAEGYYRRISAYIQAHYTIKKLDEMLDYQHKANKVALPPAGYFSVADGLRYLGPSGADARKLFFHSRLQQLIEASTEGETLDPEIQRILDLNLDDFDAYIEILVALRGAYHRRFITECLDTLFLKNTDANLVRQARTKGSPRRFMIGSKLLEVLLQVAVLKSEGSSFVTREIRIDELIVLLRERYGLYIDTLPSGEGFSSPSIQDLQALRRNRETFKTRLREIGFFQDLSDAYITQTVTPRYTIQSTHIGV